MITVALINALNLAVANNYLTSEEVHDYLHSLMYPPAPVLPGPDLLDSNEKIENTIEKEDLPEQALDEIDRIPMIKGDSGINLQFEGQEEILPISIS
jgi:hypothetical protein